jgi:formylglycine-generating enzyme required for sulfatase activity
MSLPSTPFDRSTSPAASDEPYELAENEPFYLPRSLGREKHENSVDPVGAAPRGSLPIARPERTAWIAYGIAVIVGAVVGVAGDYAVRHGSVAPAEQPPPAQTPSQSQLRPEHLLAAAQRSAAPPPTVEQAAPPAATSPLPAPSAMAEPTSPWPVSPPAVEPPATTAQAPPKSAIAMVKPPPLPSRAAGAHQVFRECEQCPEMVSLPGATFTMGSNDDPSEKPAHQVTVPPFALGRSPVTVGEWKHCVAAKACDYAPAADDDTPVHNVSWSDAQQYVAWLSKVTQARYRLPTEAEWEYAARAGASTKYWWGDRFKAGMANCKDCGDNYDASQPMKVASFAPNPFGIYDMTGGVAQWVSDCWHKDYKGAPADGSAWDAPNCRERVLRGGSWRNDATYLRASSRHRYDPGVRYLAHGFRLARSGSD